MSVTAMASNYGSREFTTKNCFNVIVRASVTGRQSTVL